VKGISDEKLNPLYDLANFCDFHKISIKALLYKCTVARLALTVARLERTAPRLELTKSVPLPLGPSSASTQPVLRATLMRWVVRVGPSVKWVLQFCLYVMGIKI
jgi:hypothetical protein